MALAYLVAGPEIRKILRPQLNLLSTLRDKLAKFQADGRAGNIADRAELVRLAGKVLSTGRYRADRVNFAGTAVHFGLAIGCFVFLLQSSMCTHMYSGWLMIGCLTVACAIFLDPLMILRDAWYLSRLFNRVFQIGNISTRNDPDGQKVRDATAAIIELADGKRALADTSRLLKMILQGRAAETELKYRRFRRRCMN